METSLLYKKFAFAKSMDEINDEFKRVSDNKEFVQNLASRKYKHNYLRDEFFISEKSDEETEVPVLIGSHPDDDFKNAKALYEGLVDLPENAANDLRLWNYLALVPYANYIQLRYPPGSTSLVKTRYFFSGSATSNATHAIARLWWSVHRTKITESALLDEKKGNAYFYTEIFFSKTDIVQAIAERKEIFKNQELVFALLDFVNDLQFKNQQPIRILAKLILNHIRSFNIDLFTKEDFKKLIQDLYDNQIAHAKT